MGCQRGAGPLVNLRFMGVYTILRVLSIPWNKLTECRRNCPERVSADDFDAVLVRRKADIDAILAAYHVPRTDRP